MDEEPGSEVNLWEFHIVAPEVEEGMVMFSFGIDDSVSEMLRDGLKCIWSVLLEEVDDTARRQIEDTLP